jgi:hypothetical protein
LLGWCGLSPDPFLGGGASPLPTQIPIMQTDKTKKLLWNEAGQLGCTLPGHAPHRGSDTWVSERWRPLTLNERVDLAAELGHMPQCEVCAARTRRGREAS